MNKIFNMKKALPLDKKNITFMVGMIGAIYIALIYLLGIYFGFYISKFRFSLEIIEKYIIPLLFFIIITEYIREKILFGNLKHKKILAFLILFFSDIIINIKNYNLTQLNDFLEFTGYVACVSIANNMLFNYISIRYGKNPNIIYRSITTIYVYLFPLIPNVHILFHTLIKLLLPYIIYSIIESTYYKKTYLEKQKENKFAKIINIILIILMLVITMLVTCKFKYGSLVIGSGSMTGTLNKGDMIIFEKYPGSGALNNQIIIFNKDDNIIVHRIVEIRNINGEKRYYTKGDANKERDEDYVIDDQIIGLYKFKINKIGELTLLFNDLFEK